MVESDYVFNRINAYSTESPELLFSGMLSIINDDTDLSELRLYGCRNSRVVIDYGPDNASTLARFFIVNVGASGLLNLRSAHSITAPDELLEIADKVFESTKSNKVAFLDKGYLLYNGDCLECVAFMNGHIITDIRTVQDEISNEDVDPMSLEELFFGPRQINEMKGDNMDG